MKDRTIVVLFAIFMVAFVLSTFVTLAYGAMPQVTVEFDSVPIQQPGGAIDGCLFTVDGKSIVVVQDCYSLADEQIRILRHDNPLIAFDFIVDGESWVTL